MGAQSKPQWVRFKIRNPGLEQWSQDRDDVMAHSKCDARSPRQFVSFGLLRVGVFEGGWLEEHRVADLDTYRHSHCTELTWVQRVDQLHQPRNAKAMHTFVHSDFPE